VELINKAFGASETGACDNSRLSGVERNGYLKSCRNHHHNLSKPWTVFFVEFEYYGSQAAVFQSGFSGDIALIEGALTMSASVKDGPNTRDHDKTGAPF
jgi:hypothetical protein